jgi:8-oxo-dGTP pyrophosphatase MutT (NUDIX family)
VDDDSHLSARVVQRWPGKGLGSVDAPAYSQPMAPTIRARRLAYRVAAQLLRFLRPLVPIDWGGVKCVLTDGDRVLLVRHTYGSRQWDLPGGGRHRGERSIDAARREMHEELGLQIDNWRELGRLLARTERHRQTIDVFGAELSSPTLELDVGEIQVAAWFARDRLPLDTARFVAPILTGAGLTPPP